MSVAPGVSVLPVTHIQVSDRPPSLLGSACEINIVCGTVGAVLLCDLWDLALGGWCFPVSLFPELSPNSPNCSALVSHLLSGFLLSALLACCFTFSNFSQISVTFLPSPFPHSGCTHTGTSLCLALPPPFPASFLSSNMAAGIPLSEAVLGPFTAFPGTPAAAFSSWPFPPDLVILWPSKVGPKAWVSREEIARPGLTWPGLTLSIPLVLWFPAEH
ncbi:hypothetical protein XENTR_v10015741 [Xenopus tropicalis]|nr:hypothetical protein XENTR_v10015741 [Xenopus tropicalis]